MEHSPSVSVADPRPVPLALRGLGLCVPAVLLLALGKALAGEALSLSALHVLLVVGAAWYLGRLPAVVVASLCALAYLVVHVAVLGDRSVPEGLLDAGLQALVYGAASALVSRFRRDFETREAAAVQAALEQVRMLKGSHVLCPGCRRVRDEQGGWEELERWVTLRTAAGFAHLRCPDCAEKT